MGIDSFIGSTLFWVIVYVVICWYVLKIVSEELLGQPIGEFIMSNRIRSFEDIDALDHLHLFKDLARSARFSRPARAQWLYIKPLDPHYYTTEWAGMLRVGKIKGLKTTNYGHEVLWRKPWRIRKFIFIAPPETCLSGTASRNVVYEGQSLEVLNTDYIFAVPSPGYPETEQMRREWALDWYRVVMKQHSYSILVDQGEFLLKKSAADTVEARMAQQQIADMMGRTESGEGEYTQGAEVMD